MPSQNLRGAPGKYGCTTINEDELLCRKASADGDYKLWFLNLTGEHHSTKNTTQRWLKIQEQSGCMMYS